MCRLHREPFQVYKMLEQLFVFIFLISLSQSCLQSATQVNYANAENSKVTFVPNGETFFIDCPLDSQLLENHFNITWFKNGSHVEISRDIEARVQQDNNYLKFLPARLEDSGFYSCVLQNSEGCLTAVIEVNVFQNDDGLCYKIEALYDFRPVLESSLTIQCPYVTHIVDIETAQFHWFKECKPLDLTTDKDKYLIKKHFLNIIKVSQEDRGYYTCVTSFIHNGTNYNISRSINYSIRESPLISKPVILHPTDNFIDADLGAPITITCQAALSGNLYLSWRYNDSFISDYYDDGRVIEGENYNAVTEDGQKVSNQNLTFLTVKEEDFGRQFFCYAEIFPAHNMAFFILKKTDPNFQGFLIAFFLTAVFCIITSVIIMKVFKVDIVLWYRSSCFSHPHQNDGKLYDAYIMYPRNGIAKCAHDMDLFVLKLLPEVLEKQCAYRLFIIGRDDLPGQAMADLVNEAISQSRRLIIVLGQVSNETNLGEDFEQKIAMYDALIRNEIKVILIEMEKITDYTFMPESIIYIKQKQGAVRWKDTFSEASLSPSTRFWKNVRYRMPSAPRQKDLNYASTENL